MELPAGYSSNLKVCLKKRFQKGGKYASCVIVASRATYFLLCWVRTNLALSGLVGNYESRHLYAFQTVSTSLRQGTYLSAVLNMHGMMTVPTTSYTGLFQSSHNAKLSTWRRISNGTGKVSPLAIPIFKGLGMYFFYPDFQFGNNSVNEVGNHWNSSLHYFFRLKARV